MFLPGQDATDYYKEYGKFFPFYIAILNNRLYVNMNCTADTSIPDGAEILSINNVKTSDILKRLLQRQIRDGKSKTYPVWILTNYFKEYFSFSFGHPESFSLHYKKGNSERQGAVTALSRDSIKYYRETKYANRNSLANEKQGVIFNLNNSQNVATLVIKSFDDDILKSVYKQDFDSAMKTIFKQIDSLHSRNLILDLRNNQGGDFGPSKVLLSYLIRQTVKYLSGTHEAETILPRKRSYKGNLYILINGGSFSSTAILCSYLEFTKRAVFIGDETGGNKVIISGDPVELILPNTKILCEISTTKYIIRNSKNTGHGIMPAYHVTPAIADIISGQDPAMDFALKLVQNK
jgi:C-terminal processing protease CtpA/Prc